MGAKKVRVTNELIQRLGRVGVENLSRKELRALFRKGYIDRQIVKTGDGSVRYAYKLASSNLIKEASISNWGLLLYNTAYN